MQQPRTTSTSPSALTVESLSRQFPGWTIFRSDKDRLWATRSRPFSRAAEKAGAFRTVDGDDLIELCRSIADQESAAELAPRLPAVRQ